MVPSMGRCSAPAARACTVHAAVTASYPLHLLLLIS
jgi:hypothetical protein